MRTCSGLGLGLGSGGGIKIAIIKTTTIWLRRRMVRRRIRCARRARCLARVARARHWPAQFRERAVGADPKPSALLPSPTPSLFRSSRIHCPTILPNSIGALPYPPLPPLFQSQIFFHLLTY